MLFSLAQQGNAPHFVEKLTKKGVPFAGVLVTALATFASVIINFLLPQRAFEILLALVIASALITWAMISVSHLKFKVAMKAKGITTSFKAILSPASNYLCLLFIVFIVMMMANSEQWMAVMLIPVWLSFLGIAYLYKRKWISNN
jgi:aromatic amino acid transport protein AroP